MSSDQSDPSTSQVHQDYIKQMLEWDDSDEDKAKGDDSNEGDKVEDDSDEHEVEGEESDEEMLFDEKPMMVEEVAEKFDQLIEWRNKFKDKSKGKRTDAEYKQFALNLYLSDPQAYCFWHSFLHLPKEHTLETFKVTVRSKIDDTILDLLSSKLKSLPEKAKYVTLCVDQIDLSRHLDYDTQRDQILGFHDVNGEPSKEIASNAYAAVIQSIAVKWTQPISYSLMSDVDRYKELEVWLDDIITQLSTIGIEVLAIVSDQGSKFDKYAKDVKNVTAEKPYFFVNDRKVYYIFDVPRLINRVRNVFLCNNFVFDGKIITWKHVEELYTIVKQNNLKLIPKLTQHHIKPKKFHKKRVKYAAQIFSSSVCGGINLFIAVNKFPDKARATAEFIGKMNDFFDVLNSSSFNSCNKYQKAFAMKDYQMELLESMATMFKNMEIVDAITGSDNTKKFKAFKHMQITIEAVKMLAKDLEEKGITNILTRRLNLDCLGNLLGEIRKQTCKTEDEDPKPIQFVRTFSRLFLSNILKRSVASYTERDMCELLREASIIAEKHRS